MIPEQPFSSDPDNFGNSKIMSFDEIREMEKQLLCACPIEARQAFARFLQMLPSLPHEQEMILFKQGVDDSDFSMADWAVAAAIFQEWLEGKKRVSNFSKKLGYLSCCAESMATTPPALRTTLAAQVSFMLENYGFLG
ncbi:MAG: hypothetical protein LBV12_02240 [Puniceicoccales bacterium]|jgi:hypothetical protein|nr:hypothetical protein [Puniceicoccales bacterium]